VSNGRAASNGVFDLDAAIATVVNDADHTPFRFRFFDTEWELPHLGTLDVWTMVAAAEAGDTGAALSVLELAFGQRWEEFHGHPLPQLGLDALFRAYSEHSGLTPGESVASTGSSASTGRRSKQISTATTAKT
jgi:hypothetical protein